MSINNTAYDTTLGKSLSLDKTLHALQRHLVSGSIGVDKINLISSTDFLPLEVNPATHDSVDIPLFGHPLLLENFKNKSYLAVDLRLVLREESNGDLVSKNNSEYDFAYSRYVINYSWIDGGISSIKNSLEFGSTVYCQWLSEIISRRFALDPKDQILLAIISNIFYQTLFYDAVDLSENYKQLLASQVIRATNAPSDLVFEVIDKITPMSNIDDYCNNVKTILENIRLKDFNKGILFTIVGMSWYGLNAKETIIMSLEHIPTWVAICYSALTQRTYKSTTIYRIAERYGKRGASDEFIGSYINLVKSLEATDTTSVGGVISESIGRAIESLELVTL